MTHQNKEGLEARLLDIVRADADGAILADNYITLVEAASELSSLREENERLRKVVSACADGLPNGAFVVPEATIEFMEKLPSEIRAVSSASQAQMNIYREALENMRCPRPCNHRPDDFDTKDCFAAGECGCIAFAALSQNQEDSE